MRDTVEEYRRAQVDIRRIQRAREALPDFPFPAIFSFISYGDVAELRAFLSAFVLMHMKRIKRKN